jgi:small subunit ribosomal protein S8
MTSDPIADMLTRVRNALLAGHKTVVIPHSSIKNAIAHILLEEGFITGVKVIPEKPQAQIEIRLKYIGRRRDQRPVINGLKRISKPGRRTYTKRMDIPWVQSGMGVAILSTPKGVMTGQKARRSGIGGEVLCYVW